MTIKATYNQAMIDKAHAIVAEAEAQALHVDRDRFCQERCGLTYQYLKRIGKTHKHPSARTIMNMGYELYVRDLATGELSKLEAEVKCDWNPQNPRMNPVCTPVFVQPASETSSSSE